jgi:nucleotide-binding universal stress UspA family protein
MAKRRARGAVRQLRVVVGSDGSPPAREAVQAAVVFPWPPRTQAVGVVARGLSQFGSVPTVVLAVDAAVRRVAAETERQLRRRWPDAAVVVPEAGPVDAILQQARGASCVVVGARGHSKLARWVLGSVSTAVMRQATVPVLVVKERPRAFAKIVIAYDGSAHAKRAIAWVARLELPRRARVTLHTMTERVPLPTMHLLPASVRATLAAEARSLAAERAAKARRALERAARPLADAGWRVRLDVRSGIATRDLAAVPAEFGADLLVIGAQGSSRWKQMLLGSVAQSAVERAPCSVLVVR